MKVVRENNDVGNLLKHLDPGQVFWFVGIKGYYMKTTDIRDNSCRVVNLESGDTKYFNSLADVIRYDATVTIK